MGSEEVKRKIYHVDISHMSTEEAEEFIDKIRAKLKGVPYKEPSKFRKFMKKWFGWLQFYH